VASLDPSAWSKLQERLGLDDTEIPRWRSVGEALVDNLDPESLVYEQFTGFFELDEERAADLADRPFGGDMLLGVERVRRTQVVKQADVLMLPLTLPEAASDEVWRANYECYEPRTSHGSSLSPAVHAAVAARIGALEDADWYFRLAAGIDLENRMGNAAQGVHIATMGGLWQAAVMGFGGVRAEADALRLDPRLPPSWEGLSFPVRWRGTRVHVEVVGDTLTVRLDGQARVAVGTEPASTLEAGHFVARRQGDGWSALEAP
jgi:kojibiose phosphorylase